MAIVTRLAPGPIAPDMELRRFTEALAGAGAVTSFTGIARPTSAAGAAVASLFLEHYPGMTEKSLQTIARDAAARFRIEHVLIVHRCGAIAPGEPIVFVAAAAAHRRAAFLAADYMMDRLKSEAAFWKREEGVDGARWIEPSEADRADLARWRE